MPKVKNTIYRATSVYVDGKFQTLPVLFDSVDFVLNMRVFIKEFLFFFFFPLGYIRIFAYNKRKPYKFEHSHNDDSFLVLFLSSVSFFLMVISYFATDESLEYGIIPPTGFYIVHKLLLAIRFASLSDTEYNKIRREPFGEALRQYLNQSHLLTGWERENRVVIDFEVAAAAARAGIQLDKLQYFLPGRENLTDEQLVAWNSMLAPVGERVRTMNGNLCVSVKDVCAALVIRSYERIVANTIDKKLTNLLYIYCSFNMCIPFFRPRLWHAGFFMDFWVIIYYVTSSFLLLVNGIFVVFMFKYVLTDQLRRVYMVESLHEMIRADEKYLFANMKWKNNKIAEDSEVPENFREKGELSEFDFAEEPDDFFQTAEEDCGCGVETVCPLPKLTFAVSNNIFAWLYTRNIMQSYGVRCRAKLTSVFWTATLVFFICCVLVIINLSDLQGAAAFHFINIVMVRQVLLGVIMLSVFICWFIYAGTLGNLAYEDHKDTIMALTVHCGKMKADLEDKKHSNECGIEERIQIMNGLESSFDRCFSAIELSNESNPCKVLGFTASFDVLASFVTTILSFFAYVLSSTKSSGDSQFIH